MTAATQPQVRRAIEQSNASGTAAEVLEAITALSVERSNSDLQTSRALTIAIGPEAAATALGGLKAAAATNPLFDSMYIALSSTGLDFAYPMVQQMIDTLTASGAWSSDLGALLKALGIWSESPLEHHNATRGLTTDEATVQEVLDTIASEQEPQVYDHRQALLSIVLQSDGKAIVSCRVVATTETGQQGETLSAVSTADADSFELPSDLAAALAAVRQFVAGV